MSSRSKIFMTYEQQIEKLLDKKMIIPNKEYAISLLKDHSYFGLINGYKKQFKRSNGDYKPHVSIDDVYALYVFDDNLRTLFLQYILQVEKCVKSHISYIFCSEYGEFQEAYLDKNNYKLNKYTEKSIEELIVILQTTIKMSKNYTYIEHQKTKHKNVPLWVLMKALTLGKVSKIHALLPQKMQNAVRKEFVGIRENELIKMLEILTHCRNACAHSERLYDLSFRKSTIDDTAVHASLAIQKRGHQFSKGKNDLFAVVITLKYLLKSKDFQQFFTNLDRIIKQLFSSTPQIPKEQMLKHMGFPENWKAIQTLNLN